MSDDGSITVARSLREATERLMAREIVLDLRPILGVDAMIVSQAADGASGAAWKLSTLIDPMTRPTADGSCDRCGAPAEALKDQYCAHCGRRVIREGR